ncbi:MAG: YceI family protein [Pseudomonadota bacterium]
MVRTTGTAGLCLVALGLGIFAACTDNSGATTTESAAAVEFAGPWTLSGEESAITYLSIKNDAVAEPNTFGALEGMVDESGAAEITIDLNSVNTNVDIRNERMREVFFQTDTYPTATATTELDMAQFETLALGDSVSVPLDLNITLHGESQSNYHDVAVTRLGPNKVLVSSETPLILYAEDFGLLDGLSQLQALAGLDGITPIVPVNVSFVFERTT